MTAPDQPTITTLQVASLVLEGFPADDGTPPKPRTERDLLNTAYLAALLAASRHPSIETMRAAVAAHDAATAHEQRFLAEIRSLSAEGATTRQQP
ncbi:MAG: hypothetical protein J0H82_26060 [Alphaproteobacteria bacterium]|jgi:hypothetical protein|nr:hypothetical protein [Alphaproteobacteria bacterium]